MILPQVERDRQELQDIFQGKLDKKILIIGPCSAWPMEALLDYAQKLLPWKQKMQAHTKLVLRVYTQKSRTKGGWSGIMKEPHPQQEANLEEGMKQVKELRRNLIAMGHALADEAVFLYGREGMDEDVAWLVVGARSVENPEHRIFASFCEMPVGFKNPRNGNLDAAFMAIEEAKKSHTHWWQHGIATSKGNPQAHLVLRGAQGSSNIHAESFAKILEQQVPFLVDLSHDNREPQAYEKMQNLLRSMPELEALWKGCMLESFLKEGSQNLSQNLLDEGGLSITDPCLSWEQTEDFLTKWHEDYGL